MPFTEQEKLLLIHLDNLHNHLADEAADTIRALHARCKLLEARLTLAERAGNRRHTSVHTFHPQTSQTKEQQP